MHVLVELSALNSFKKLVHYVIFNPYNFIRKYAFILHQQQFSVCIIDMYISYHFCYVCKYIDGFFTLLNTVIAKFMMISFICYVFRSQFNHQVYNVTHKISLENKIEEFSAFNKVAITVLTRLKRRPRLAHSPEQYETLIK